MVINANWQEKQTASYNLGLALQKLGFVMEGLRHQQTGQEYQPASWVGGRAVPLEYPDYAIECFSENVGRGKFFCICWNGLVLKQYTGYAPMANNTANSTSNANQKAAVILAAIKSHHSVHGHRAKAAPSKHFPNAGSVPVETSPPTITPQEPLEWACPEEITIRRNLELDGIEIRFPEKPSSAVRAWLKTPGHRFRFSNSGGDERWYAKYNPTMLKQVLEHFGAEQEQKAS